MWRTAAISIAVAIAAGALIGTATSDSDVGVAFRDGATAMLSPASGLMAWWRDSSPFYSHDVATDEPTSALDSFLKSDKPDPDFVLCLGGLAPDAQQAMQELAEYHSHRATAGLVECLLSRDPQRFCKPLGRRQAVDAIELYFWSRENGIHPSQGRLMAEKMRHLEDDTSIGPQSADADADPYERTWDGPEDRAILSQLKTLVSDGYLDSAAFGFFPRPQVRDALRDLKPQRAACAAVNAG